MHGERKIPLLLFNIGQRERERERVECCGRKQEWNVSLNFFKKRN